MDKQTTGTVIAAAKQWWMKVNRKPMRMHALDGAEFPYIVKIEYIVDGKAYTKRKWISVGAPVPKVGSIVQVIYNADKPSKAKILWRLFLYISPSLPQMNCSVSLNQSEG